MCNIHTRSRGSSRACLGISWHERGDLLVLHEAENIERIIAEENRRKMIAAAHARPGLPIHLWTGSLADGSSLFSAARALAALARNLPIPFPPARRPGGVPGQPAPAARRAAPRGGAAASGGAGHE